MKSCFQKLDHSHKILVIKMNNEDYLKTLRQSLLKIEELEYLLKKSQDTSKQAIAIIGIGCRFPGGANSITSFGELLMQGFDSTCEVPKNRWEIDHYYDANPNAKGKIISRKGSFLNVPIDEFDATFFGMSPREVEYLDPQQRLLLEVTWEAIENAGINPNNLKNSHTGVFIGLSTHDYWDLLTKSLQDEFIEAYLGTGNIASTAAGRISYTLGLKGPSCVVDTACSSSLLAIHQGCQSLRIKESNLIIAGGVNILLSPLLSINFSQAHMLAADGFCKTFDKDADGYVRGEGCGVIILKRLQDALDDGDSIWGVIKGSAVNQDGTSSSLTVPNGPSQEEVITAALTQAQLKPNDIDYIEAHGTGTKLGDPIEFNAISHVFGKNNNDDNRTEPLIIGTVKTNIGHLEAAAGVAGVIKTLLALQYEKIPQHLHFNSVNPAIDFEKIPAKIPLAPISWNKQSHHVRRAGISSFGFSGTNVHIILEEAPTRNKADSELIEKLLVEANLPHLFLISAKNEDAIEQQIKQYISYLKQTNEPVYDICYTTQSARSCFENKIGVIGKNTNDLIYKLENREFISSETLESYSYQYPDHISKFLNKVMLPTYPFNRIRYWAKCLGEQLKDASDKEPLSFTDSIEQLKPSDVSSYSEILVLVREQVLTVLSLPSTAKVDDIGFFEQGLDSLMAAELARRITQLFPVVKLSSTAAYDYPTISKLSSYIESQLTGRKLFKDIIPTAVSNEPIAIVGLSCRFPAGANNPEQFWQLLSQGVDAGAEIPLQRWDMSKYYSDDPQKIGNIYTARAALLNSSIEEFDANFFGISPREAILLDPQQRLLLEMTWEALEGARIKPLSLQESLTGVFIGIYSSDYKDVLRKYAAPESVESFMATGTANSTAAGRISYTLGLRGPCFAIDTACSSALVAVHQACQSIRNGESNLAIAGGVNIILSPDAMVLECSMKMLSPEGKCKTFDKSADGFMRGEGGGVIILKKLSAALQDGNKILAVISGSSVNQDGASSGLTVPNGPAQVEVIKRALSQAQLNPDDIDYIESHGTGTSVGDPIEINALYQVFGREQSNNQRITPLIIGTVKTNIGHTEAAAGIAGLIKTVLSLQYEEIPKHLHFKEYNPGIIAMEEIPAQLPLNSISWPKAKNHIRRAGISSFSFSGTNVHVILEEAPEQDEATLIQSLPLTIFNRQRYWPACLESKFNPPSHENTVLFMDKIEQIAPCLDASTYEDILKLIREQAFNVLALTSGSCENDDIGFFDLGIDSLMASELGYRLSKLFPQLSLRSSAVYDYPTISKLAHYIYTEVAGTKTDSYSSIISAKSTVSSGEIRATVYDMDKDALYQALQEEINRDVRK